MLKHGRELVLLNGLDNGDLGPQRQGCHKGFGMLKRLGIALPFLGLVEFPPRFTGPIGTGVQMLDGKIRAWRGIHGIIFVLLVLLLSFINVRVWNLLLRLVGGDT